MMGPPLELGPVARALLPKAWVDRCSCSAGDEDATKTKQAIEDLEDKPSAELTYGDLIKMFKKRNPDLARCVDDYRNIGTYKLQLWLIDGTELYMVWVPEIKGFVFGGAGICQ